MAWNITEATYVRKSAAQSGYFDDIRFSLDGMKMYMPSTNDETIKQYSLTTAWNVSTISYVQQLVVNSTHTDPKGIYISDDGMKLIYISYKSKRFVSYYLSTAWDITTGTLVNTSDSVDIQLGEGYPTGMGVKYDGTHLYLCGYDTNKIWDIPLTTAWNVSTADFTNVVSTPCGASIIYGMFIAPDGKTLWTLDNTGDWMRQYDLTTDWDITTKSYVGAIDVGAGGVLDEYYPRGVFVTENGQNLFMIGTGRRKVFQWSMPAPYVPPDFIPRTHIL